MAKSQNPTVFICSKLPNGLIIQHPMRPEFKQEIKGVNGAERGIDGKPILVLYMVTEIDAELWDSWHKVYNSVRPFGPLRSGAIWQVKSMDEAKASSRERAKELTGLHPMARDKDARMGGDGKLLKPLSIKDE